MSYVYTATPTTVDPITATVEILVIGFLVIAVGYIVSLILQKRTLDMVQTAGSSTLAATQYLISSSIYYGAYERSETLRTIASIIGGAQIGDTALEFVDTRNRPQSSAQPGAK
jgi:hypothetical protein